MAIIPGLVGKIAIVTGGASGIGAACVRQFGLSGATVMIADMNSEAGNALAAEINGFGNARAAFVRTDVTSEGDVRNMVDTALSTFGRLDCAVNAAGLPNRGKILHEVGADEFSQVINVNLVGMFLSMKHQAAAMLKTGGGSIVAISSSVSVMAIVNAAEYCASKAGVDGLVRAAALDYADKGIRVNAVLPGPVRTPMMERAVAQASAPSDILAALPMKRWAEPDEIAAAALWLASDQASYVSGTTMSVDGALSVG